MIFTRETVPATMRRGMWVLSRSTPSTRKRTRMSRPSGSKWMSEAPSSTPWAMIEFTSLITGASSAVSRTSATSSISSSPCFDRGGHGVVELAHAADQAVDVLDPGDHGQNLVAGHQLQVVEREHVRRVRHRDEQVSAVVEADRHRSEPARGRRADEVQRSHVGLVDREVDVLEAEALRHRARELVTGDGARLEQDLLGRAALRLALLDCRLHALGGDEVELHEHVGDQARAAAARRSESVVRSLGAGGLVRAPVGYGAQGGRTRSALAHRASATS